MTSAGCSLVVYLPFVFTPTSQVNFQEHMSSHTTASWTAVGTTVLILACGVLIRKLGTVLTDDTVVSRVENFLYRVKRE